MKKIIRLLGVLGVAALLLSACKNQKDATPKESKSDSERMYKVKITKISPQDDGDWLAHGTAKAPNGTIVAAVLPNKFINNAYTNDSFKMEEGTYVSTVDNNQFTLRLSPRSIDSRDVYTTKMSLSFYIFGISNQKKLSIENPEDTIISKTIKKQVERTVDLTKFNYTAIQIKKFTDDDKEVEEMASSDLAESKKESLASESSEKAESKKEETKAASESIKKAHSSASNTVYGQFEDDGFDERSAGYYVQTVSALKIGYGVGEDNSVKVVKIDSRELPYSLSLDKDAISEQITDYTAPDAKLSQTISNKEFIYHSDKLDKNYKVRYQLNTDDELTIIFINQY